MTVRTTMNDSSLINATISSMVHQVAEAAAAAVFEKGVEKLPPPTHTVFFLENKHDRKLNIIMGEVKITSTSMPEKHMTLTTSRWARLMSIRRQINIELEKVQLYVRSVAYRAHIGDNYYVSVTSEYDCVDIRHFYVPYGLPCDHVRPSRNGLALRLDEWKHLLKLVPTIHKYHPELIIAEPSDEESSQSAIPIHDKQD